jgi:hypothetical protein
MTVRAKTSEASTAGSFAPHERSAPETAISPRALGAIGLGPHRDSVYLDRVDARVERGERPARPYLPLQPADDDEFFDAPTGSVLITRGEDGKVASRHAKFHTGTWRELSERGVPSAAEIEPGDLWATRFSEEDGTMSPTVLVPPHGLVYSDRGFYAHRDQVETPITADDAVSRFAATGGRATVVARHVFGDDPGGTPGVRAAAYDEDVVVAFQGDDIVVGGISTHQAFPRDKAMTFERDGHIVFRREDDEGYGYELALEPRTARD